MLAKVQIVGEIEAVVSRYGAGRYRMWFVGIAPDAETMKRRRCDKSLYLWEAQSEALAKEIRDLFLEKGMVSDCIHNSSGRYVHIF